MQETYINYVLSSSRITIVMMLLPIGVAIFQKSKSDAGLKIFLYWLIATFFLSILEQLYIYIGVNHYTLIEGFVTRFKVRDTNFLGIFYYLKNLFFLSWFYSELLPRHPKTRLWLKRIAVFGAITMLINYFFIEGYRIFGVYNPVFDSLFCSLVALYYLRVTFNSNLDIPLHRNAYFYISAGIFVVSTIGLLFYLVGDNLQAKDYILYLQAAIARNAVDILSQILFAVGFYQTYYLQFLEK